MDDFLHELGLLLEWVEGTGDLNSFEKEFSMLVKKYRMNDDVIELANVIAHNYTCHKHNRKDALVNDLEQWRSYKKEV